MKSPPWYCFGLILTAAVTMLNCSGDPVAPAVPAGIGKVSGDGQIGPVGTTLRDRLVVVVTDATEAGLAGIPVTFSVTRGGGSVDAGEVVTDSRGMADVAWTLGNVHGVDTQTLRVTIAELPDSPVTFTASSTLTGPPWLRSP